MPQIDRQHYALQTIFSFFLGLMVLAFIGVGVNTFYPSPAEQQQSKQNDLQRQIDAINVNANGRSLDATRQAQVDRLISQQNQLSRSVDGAMKTWARNTSIILVVFATMVLVISLTLSEQLRVLSNGLLLGGLFTMLYGTGWVIFSGSSTARFFIIAFALVVAIGLGYLKFVRGRAEQPVGAQPEAASARTGAVSTPTTELEARVAALEAKAQAASEALGGEKN